MLNGIHFKMNIINCQLYELLLSKRSFSPSKIWNILIHMDTRNILLVLSLRLQRINDYTTNRNIIETNGWIGLDSDLRLAVFPFSPTINCT